MRLVDLSQDNDQWLAWRKEGVTATDAVIISGRSPYKTEWRLWAEKVDYARPVDLSLNPLVRWGKENEPLARQAAEEHFNDMIVAACVESSTDPIIRASLDGLNSQNEPVELKCPSQKVWNEVCTEGSASLAYRMYWVQCQYQMLALGAKKGHLVFWYDGQLKCFEIQADKAFLSDLYAKVKEFWKQVVNRVEPTKDPKRDLFIPEGQQVDQWIAAAKIFTTYREQIKALQDQITELRASEAESLGTLMELMGEYYHADYCGVKVTRYVVRGSVDYDNLIADKAAGVTQDDIDQYRRPSSERWRVTLADSELPSHIIEPDVIEPIEQAKDFEVLYF